MHKQQPWLIHGEPLIIIYSKSYSYSRSPSTIVQQRESEVFSRILSHLTQFLLRIIHLISISFYCFTKNISTLFINNFIFIRICYVLFIHSYLILRIHILYILKFLSINFALTYGFYMLFKLIAQDIKIRY